MGMAGILLLSADVFRYGLELAFLRMRMACRLRQGTHQTAGLCAACFCMHMDRTQQRLAVAFLCMGMGLLTTEGIRFHGNRRKDQCVGGTEYDQTHHHADNSGPEFFAPFPLKHQGNFLFHDLFHAYPSFPDSCGKTNEIRNRQLVDS